MPPNYLQIVQGALKSSTYKKQLLKESKILRDIMNDIPTRQWLFNQWQLSHDKQVLSLIVEMMKNSESIWRGGAISKEIYEQAYSKTWLWFMEKLSSYNPEKSSFTTWFNYKLRFMILDVSRQPVLASIDDHKGYINSSTVEGDKWNETVEEWLTLVKNNPVLNSKRMRKNPNINCQNLLITILSELQDKGEFSWETLAIQEGIESQTLKRFCKRRCFDCFQAIFHN